MGWLPRSGGDGGRHRRTARPPRITGSHRRGQRNTRWPLFPAPVQVARTSEARLMDWPAAVEPRTRQGGGRDCVVSKQSEAPLRHQRCLKDEMATGSRWPFSLSDLDLEGSGRRGSNPRPSAWEPAPRAPTSASERCFGCSALVGAHQRSWAMHYFLHYLRPAPGGCPYPPAWLAAYSWGHPPCLPAKPEILPRLPRGLD